jgi:hypothetical protein
MFREPGATIHYEAPARVARDAQVVMMRRVVCGPRKTERPATTDQGAPE